MATASEIASQSSVGFGESLFEAMQVTILRNILTGLGITMTTQEINTAAACFLCFGMSLPQAQALVLLNEISANVSGGGGGGAIAVTGDPNGVTTADNLQFGWDEVNDVLWIHEGADGTNTGWLQLI